MFGSTRAGLSRQISRRFIGSCSTSSYTLPDLPYGYGALEPYISGEIMELHHSKHHATYVNNLNAALTKQQEAEKANDIESVIALQSAVKFNGGGEFHTLFLHFSLFDLRSHKSQHFLEEFMSS